MLIEKCKMKAAMAEGIGRDLEKDFENIQIKVHKLQGAHDALQQAAKIVSDMSGKVRDELFDRKITFDPDDEMAVAKFIVARQQEVVAKLKELAEIALKNAIKADGERSAYDAISEKLKKVRDEELNKVSSFMAKVESGEIIIEDGVPTATTSHRPVGTHPGPTLKSQRKAEEAAEEAKSKGNGVTKKKPRRKKTKPEALDDKDA